MTFASLDLSEPILRALADAGYDTPTPIQAQAIPPVLDGRDLLGCAQTGTGKTAAFAVPVLDRLSRPTTAKKARKIRCLVLAPTRELAEQIAESFQAYGKHAGLRGVTIYGGVNQNPQVRTLKRGVDICVATPGRLLDLMNQGHVDLGGIETLVLDEADRMLDMGFIPDIRRVIAAMPTDRQTLMFSATVPPAIRKLAADLLRDPEVITLAAESSTADRVRQSVCHVRRPDKMSVLTHYIEHLPMPKTIVFTRTKHGADKVTKQLKRAGVASAAIHGNKTQNNRRAALAKFRDGHLGVLVATDVAARGIDVDDVTHVVNYDVARDPESYVHRIGRTARAGAAGDAITLCDPEEQPFLADIERLLKSSIEVRNDMPAEVARVAVKPRNGRGGEPRNGSQGGRNSRPRAGHRRGRQRRRPARR